MAASGIWCPESNRVSETYCFGEGWKETSFVTEVIMYTRMLIPLDGSIVAEQVLPYARFLAKALAIPVEFWR